MSTRMGPRDFSVMTRYVGTLIIPESAGSTPPSHLVTPQAPRLCRSPGFYGDSCARAVGFACWVTHCPDRLRSVGEYGFQVWFMSARDCHGRDVRGSRHGAAG